MKRKDATKQKKEAQQEQKQKKESEVSYISHDVLQNC